jgi:alcohol dehydrogenase YqhD (iron-dependent ADH family)
MLEGYFNNTEPESAMQDRLVEAIMKTIMESTEVILENPEDYNARANMMWSAILAFNGLTTAGMGMVSLPAHMIEHSLSALYDIAHGAGLSIVMPAWMSYVIGDNPSKFARLAREIFGVEEGDDLKVGSAGIARLRAWFASIGSPVSLKDAGIPEGDIGTIAENACELAKIWGLKNYTEEVIADILKLCK